ncbi:hypothetical protein KU710_24000, partial [Salmonella enterica subsp. enterica serovar Give]|nr:hypothetical protein [Salmonella enterica subsp. enterica serovar Give]
EALPGLLEQGGQLALLGAGDPVLQEGFLAAAAEHPGQVGVQMRRVDQINAHAVIMPEQQRYLTCESIAAAHHMRVGYPPTD